MSVAEREFVITTRAPSTEGGGATGNLDPESWSGIETHEVSLGHLDVS